MTEKELDKILTSVLGKKPEVSPKGEPRKKSGKKETSEKPEGKTQEGAVPVVSGGKPKAPTHVRKNNRKQSEGQAPTASQKTPAKGKGKKQKGGEKNSPKTPAVPTVKEEKTVARPVTAQKPQKAAKYPVLPSTGMIMRSAGCFPGNCCLHFPRKNIFSKKMTVSVLTHFWNTPMKQKKIVRSY